MKLVSVAEMRSIEQEANANGLTYEMMMENAGRGIAQEIMISYSHNIDKIVVALVGSGNNGGDALVALSYLSAAGWDTTAYLVKDRENDDPLIARLNSVGGKVFHSEEDDTLSEFRRIVQDTRVVIDGVLGTGVQLPLKSELAQKMAGYKEIISGLTDIPEIVAVDCPSGVDCDTGHTSPDCIPASLTLTMAAVKTGLFAFPAADFTGEMRVVSIGNLDHLKSWQIVTREVVTAERVAKLLPTRPKNAHKGTFGTALIVGGSINYTGSILLSGEAAYRIGAGLVTLAIPSTIYLALAGSLPEVTWILLPEEMGVIANHGYKIIHKHIDKAKSLLIGPGFGLEDTSREFLANLFGYRPKDDQNEIGFVRRPSKPDEIEIKFPPLVIDADGLKLISKLDQWFHHIPQGSILTPHPREMEIISGIDKSDIQRNRIGVAQECAQKWGQIVILKGANSVIAAPDGRLAVIPVATPALARAGTGDVLAGLISGLLAQGVPAYEAAIAGAWIHARAGLNAAERIGNTASVLAGDVLDSVQEVMTELTR